MTVQEVSDVVQTIRNVRRDYERAHAMEDNLWKAVLQWIAENGKGPNAKLAAEALKTLSIDFPRYTA